MNVDGSIRPELAWVHRVARAAPLLLLLGAQACRDDAARAAPEPFDANWTWSFENLASSTSYPNGQLESRGVRVGDTQQGYWESWHLNGQLASRGEYLDGERIRDWEFYAEDGSRIESLSGRYAHGLRVSATPESARSATAKH